MCLNVLRKRFYCLRWISGSKRGPGLGDDRRRRLLCLRTVMLLAAERICESDHTRDSDEHPQQIPRAKSGATSRHGANYQLPGTSPCASQFSISFTIPSSLIFTNLRPFSAEASLT